MPLNSLMPYLVLCSLELSRTSYLDVRQAEVHSFESEDHGCGCGRDIDIDIPSTSRYSANRRQLGATLTNHIVHRFDLLAS